MNHQPVSTPSVHPAVGFSHATRVGNLVFVAGQVSKDKAGNIVGKGDINAQVTQVFENIKAILADAGCTMDDVVKLTTFTVDIKYRPVIAEVRTHYWKEYFPPNTMVAITSLVDPDLLVEIEAVAALPQK